MLALKFGLVPDDLKQQAFNRLADDVASRGNHLSTGFLGTPFLLNVLQDGGRGDLAYKLLTQDTYPSWGYMLSRGGTTIWERWDGIRPDGSLQDAGMNSFNHYGLGLDRRLALRRRRRPRARARRATRSMLVKPSTGAELTARRAASRPPTARRGASWSRDAAGRLEIDVDVPVNTRAEVHVPLADGQQVLESGKPAAEQPGVTYKGTTNGDAVYEVGSGSYRFLAAIVDATSVGGAVAGTVPATLALTLGTASLRHAHAGRRPRLHAPTSAATVTSTAGDAALSVNDPSATATGHLVNGSFALAQPLLANGTAVGGTSNPTLLASWTAPVSNDPKTITFKQSIGANEGLRTGSYARR